MTWKLRRRAARTALLMGSLIGGAVGLTGCSTLPLWMVVQGKAEITDHQHFANAPIARATVPSALPKPPPDAPVALRWPDLIRHEPQPSSLCELVSPYAGSC